MGPIKRHIRQFIEGAINCHIVRLPSRRSFAAISKDRPSDGWFLQDMHLQSLLISKRVDLVVDVGANEGQFARNLRQFYDGEIISFEPVSHPFGILSSYAARDHLWRAYKYAIGDREGEQMINVSAFSVFSSLLKTNNYCTNTFGQASAATHEEAVQVRRLDNCLRDIIPDLQSRKIFLKLDTQGYDLHAFQGLGSALSQVTVLQSEVSMEPLYDGLPHWTDSILAYERTGFRVAGMFPVVYDDRAVLEYDCIMIRRH